MATACHERIKSATETELIFICHIMLLYGLQDLLTINPHEPPERATHTLLSYMCCQ